MHNEEDVNCDEIGGLNCRKASADTILAELESFTGRVFLMLAKESGVEVNEKATVLNITVKENA